MASQEVPRALFGAWGDGRWSQLAQGMGLFTGLGAGLMTYALYMEPLDVRLERITVRLPVARGRLPAQGLRLLHLSDSHFQGRDRRERAKIERVRQLTQGLVVDLVIHTGDFLHTDEGLPNLLALLDVLPRARLGSFAVLGNHDYTRYDMSQVMRYSWRSFQQWEAATDGRPIILAPTSPWERLQQLYRFSHFLLNRPLESKRTGQNDVSQLASELTRRGVELLHNRSVRLQQGCSGLDLYLAGIDDLTEGKPDLERLMSQIPAAATTLLLSHNPDVLEWPGIQQADLLLSGHTHGGQIVLPLIGAAHTHSAHLSRREVSGYLRRGTTQVYINRGLGEGIPLRFGAPPQICLITLLAD